MKKIFRMAILLMGGATILACSNKTLNPDSGLAKLEIRSAVWSAAENPGSYTFWFSPTAGLEDVKAMTLADDYVKVVVGELGEDISLDSEGTLLSYGKYNVQASTLAEFASAELFVTLPSENTVKLSARVSDADGNGFTVDFHGFCTKCPVEPEPTRTLKLDRQVFFRYYRNLNAISGLRDYYIALSNVPYKISDGNVSLTSAGYIVAIELCAVQSTDSKLKLPTGTYSLTGRYSDRSWILGNTVVVHYNSSQSSDATYYLCDDVTISEDNGTYTIRTTFQDSDLGLTAIEYVGNIDEAEDWSALYD